MQRVRLLMVALMCSACVDLSTPRELLATDGASMGPGADAPADDGRLDPARADAPLIGGTGGTAVGERPLVDAAVGGAVPDNGTPASSPLDASPPDLPLVENGRACATNDQCRSGWCVSGLCCDNACAGLCRACNVAGKEGTCSLVPEGQSHGSDCSRTPVNTCGLDGTCDGRGACRRYPSGTECAPGSCTGSTETAASTCDGAGACRPGASRDCAPILCKQSSCAATCAQQSDCQPGFFCLEGKCAVKTALGMACVTDLQCATGHCVDRVCCATACDQPCYTCKLGSGAGSCLPVPAGMDPRDQCPSDPATTCGRTGACDGAGACQLHPTGTSCAAQTCSGNAEVSHRTCNGLGVCVPATQRDCQPYACGDGACKTTCSATGGCAAGFTCSGGACVPDQRVLHCRFDETAGPTAFDSSGNNLHGTYSGVVGLPAPSPMAAPVMFPDPGSLAFVTANQHAVRLANMPALLKPANNVTVTAWYRATAVDVKGGELVSGGDQYILRVAAAQVEFAKMIAGTHVQCYGPVTGHLDGMWHHVAGVSSPAGLAVYLDGVVRCQNTQGGDIVYNQGPDFWVGRHGNGGGNYDFGGHIDDVRVYARALTPAEILALYQGAP